ncbi:DEAD/DEAH box helicase family protein [Paenibacillus typhae]|uniref:Type III restriction enzyme, res subunit n=1 Tax=Paenibacillus typhae TaxID=1174501 RepID=A0A1G8MNK2_9BACL|nr:DEAD/DEAH box helicase family protein [Paenibacillus typhae]SDI69436.1 Type III restriction enzyme, res subunit [Paenibacillus typhae]
MSNVNLISEVGSNLHPQAYEDTLNILNSFVRECEKRNEIHWVCNSAPGQGKTTALKELTKEMASKRMASPMLIVFNNKDTMNSYYEEISEYALEHYRPFLIQYLNEDNFTKVYDEVDQYQVLCITQQRLRDLRLGYGDFNKIMYEEKEGQRARERLIIIDEMPIFVNDADFDISSKDNAVDWFDHLGEVSSLDEEDMQFGRILINKLIAREMEVGEHVTKNLFRYIQGGESGDKLNEILKKLKVDTANREHVDKYKWFLKLLRKDNVGVLDRSKYGTKIMCAEAIDYKPMGNILILDGTSDLMPSFYSGYIMKGVKNYHNYKGRLNLHHRAISTSASSRTPDTIELISEDMFKLRTKYGEILPLMAKSDVQRYIDMKVITENQISLFETKTVGDVAESHSEMPINIFNTVGKNVLSDFDSLALLNLPIRHPSSYKKYAIALFGTETNIRINDGNFSNWFEDEAVQRLYEEVFMADIVQLIHRCALRNINATTPVHIFLYTNQKRWIERLQEHFGLPNRNMTKVQLRSNGQGRFMNDCETWAVKSLEYCRAEMKRINNPLGVSVYSSTIGGAKFKEWLKRHWSDEMKREKIIEVFEKKELTIRVTSNGYKMIEFNGGLLYLE